MGGGALFQHRRRGVFVHTGGNQPAGNIPQSRQAHEEHQSGVQRRQGFKINGRPLPFAGVAGDDVERGGAVPVGHRDAVVSGNRHRRGNARHHLKGDAVFNEQFQLLAAPAEDKGVAAF